MHEFLLQTYPGLPKEEGRVDLIFDNKSGKDKAFPLTEYRSTNVHYNMMIDKAPHTVK